MNIIFIFVSKLPWQTGPNFGCFCYRKLYNLLRNFSINSNYCSTFFQLQIFCNPAGLELITEFSACWWRDLLILYCKTSPSCWPHICDILSLQREKKNRVCTLYRVKTVAAPAQQNWTELSRAIIFLFFSFSILSVTPLTCISSFLESWRRKIWLSYIKKRRILFM